MRLRVISLSVVVMAFLAVGSPVRTFAPPRRAALSADLRLFIESPSQSRVPVIAHGKKDEIRALAAHHRVRIRRFLSDAAVLELNRHELDALAGESTIDHLSGDLQVQSFSNVADRRTAAGQGRAGSPGLLLGLGGLADVTGKGVGIALLDSGISPHPALGARVVANVDMVSNREGTLDEFGHGTHIAGIITGTAAAARTVTSEYAGGIAPGAHLVNVRVLGYNGRGRTSDVIAGIDWVIANRARYNIRIINLSLGHAVMESCSTDPLCEAVERAVAAGIVVVASAGNVGRAADGSPVLGGISSPGNSPHAITVGALNTRGTVGRDDDTVTTYSSRGPTRFDLAVKPDVVAPGNKIVSLEAAGSYLSRTFPATRVAGGGTNGYLALSGTSMAAAMVSGGVALMLQTAPGLTPAQVKFALQSGSSYMVEEGLMAAGAGSVDLRSTATPGGASFRDEGTMADRMYEGNGIRLVGLFDLPDVLLNPAPLERDTLSVIGSLNPFDRIGAHRLLWGRVSSWTDSEHVTWGESITSPAGQQVIWGDTEMSDGYHVIWGDAVVDGDPE